MEKVSGFGYCSALGHKHVGVYKDDNGKYYVRIDYFRSDKTFDGLSDWKGLWECVEELEKDLLSIHALESSNEKATEGRCGIGPEPFS